MDQLTIYDAPAVDYAPGRVRRRDHRTSVDGARSVAYRAGSAKARLIDVYRAAPAGLTDEEAAVAAALPPRSCWWKRCNELRAAGAIRATGHTRVGSAGVPRIVCVAVDPC